MYMFELMGDTCHCGRCSRYWHAEGRMWGAELTAEDWDIELPDGVVLRSWGESGTEGLASHIEEADWTSVLVTSLSDGEVRWMLQTLAETSREEMLR